MEPLMTCSPPHPCPTAAILTLGCKVNQYESQAIAEALTREGIQMVSPDTPCDLYIVNTCTVTSQSDRKSRQAIRRLLSQNPNAFMLVTGCSAQLQANAIAAIPGVDAVIGNRSKMDVVQAALALLASGRKAASPAVSVPNLEHAPFEPMAITRFDRTRAYVKIQDGCQSHCTYCTIPQARGPIRSKPPQEVLEEVRSLIRGGCQEVVLTGIETGSYGFDLGSCRLADLLAEVADIPGIGRVRLGSLDPTVVTPAFAQTVARLTCMAPHFHLSMQSGSRTVLARMKRKYNPEQAIAAMDRLRAALPQVCFATDLIVGFPGETPEEFNETVEFVRQAGFLHVHVFPYSRRAGTAADRLPDQVSESIKRERVSHLSAVAAQVQAALLDTMIEQHPLQEVLFEQAEGNGAHYTGHTPAFAPVCAPASSDLRGQLHTVRLTGREATRDGYRLTAELI